MNSKRAIRETLRLCWRVWLNYRTGDITLNRFPRRLATGRFELRHVGKLNTRVLWFFMKGRRIVAVHAVRNKGQVIPTRDLQTARERMADWQKRVK